MSPDPDLVRVSGESGLTLIELVVSMVVVGIALGGTLQLVTTATRRSVDPMLERQATAIAESYLEEILAKTYYDPDSGAAGGACPAREASRSLYDDVCDYQGLDDVGARDQNGTALAGLGTYRVRVAVDAGAALGALVGPSQVLRADVRVTHPSGIDVTLSGYRTER